VRAVRKLGHDVSVRPRTTSAPIRVHGAWQMAATGLPARGRTRRPRGLKPTQVITFWACLCLRGSGMLGGVDSEPGPRPRRRREIDERLAAVRARLEELRERRRAADKTWAGASERLEAAQRHAAEAQAAAAQVLASGVEAFRHAAEAHERAASLHERAATSGVGDGPEHERQAGLQRAAATEDWRRAERAQSLLTEPERAGAASVSDEPGA